MKKKVMKIWTSTLTLKSRKTYPARHGVASVTPAAASSKTPWATMRLYLKTRTQPSGGKGFWF